MLFAYALLDVSGFLFYDKQGDWKETNKTLAYICTYLLNIIEFGFHVLKTTT